MLSIQDIAHLANQIEPMKRHKVSVVGRIYNPLGYLSPVVVQFKIFFQELCESKIDWDQPLTGELLCRWKFLISGIQGAYQLLIPRYFLEGILQRVEAYRLQGFCDASKKAYGAVVYLQIKSTTGNITRFVASKTRVAPLRKQTIPRLELLSALLLSGLMVSITNSLESILTLSEPTCYTDSKVAFYWILGTRKWKPFVQNRVTKIRKCLSPIHWKHCAGKDNPADLPSRGIPLPDLSLSQLWSEGPEWLNDDISEVHFEDLAIPEECIAELRSTESYNLLVTEKSKGLSEIIDCQQYSSINRLL